MGRIRGRDTTPERVLRARLWQRGLRYRTHSRTLPGRPDIVFTRAKVVVFVDGCFWHGCPKHQVLPGTRRAFWERKLKGNVAHDRDANRILRDQGWHVIRIWEHSIRRDSKGAADRVLYRIANCRSKRLEARLVE